MFDTCLNSLIFLSKILILNIEMFCQWWVKWLFLYLYSWSGGTRIINFSIWWWSFLFTRSALWEWTPVVSEKRNSKNIWHKLSHVLVRVRRKESVWGQYISAFSRWSLWVIDFVFMGISVEVISCRAPVILLRSNARGTRRQHSNSIMFAMESSLLCENTSNTIEDIFVLFSCNRLLVILN